jgi:hypothetical protein
MALQLLGRADGNTNFSTQSFVVTSGVTINKNDFVYLSSGKLTNASVDGQKFIGVALETQVGVAAGTIKCLVCVDPTMRYLVKNDNIGTTFAATHVGTYFDVTGATNAQLVDTSTTGTTGTLFCIEYNPQVDPVRADITYGTFVIAEHYFYPAQ